MEINRIWAYIDAQKRLNRAKENLEEYEGSIYAPSTANTSGMPIEHTNISPDKFAIIAETHSHLTEAMWCAMVEATKEYNVMIAFEQILTEEERGVFRMRYIQNKTIREIGQVMHQNERSVKYTNKIIRDKFIKFVLNIT